MPEATKKVLARIAREGPKIERRGKSLYRKLSAKIRSQYPTDYYVAINTKTEEYIGQDDSSPIIFVAVAKWGEDAPIWIQRVEGETDAKH